jgi:thioredoxin-related protein
MIRQILLVLVLSAVWFIVPAQKNTVYHPEADALAGIDAALKQAALQNKFVLIQAGGNWCSWCLEFNRVATTNLQIDSVITNGFVTYHLNYSKENQNLPIFEKYGYPQRFGFPVFIILNSKGERLHTQNSEYLEDGKKSYDTAKVISFLLSWSPQALQPGLYQ